eukprot:TRINITY_DN12216_c0_g1_i1.p1 TRINITY_DN12216_c0_g1~~TRINITY_DN12216_c0_g1_i1.p1  ORF type:complete len:188 (-),score=58.35 TRINITY_DN12216_c0_g1_i1:90-653(-)
MAHRTEDPVGTRTTGELEVLPLDTRRFDVTRVLTWTPYFAAPHLRRQIEHQIRDRNTATEVEDAEEAASENAHRKRRLWQLLKVASALPSSQQTLGVYHELVIQFEANHYRAKEREYAVGLAKSKAYEVATRDLEWTEFTVERARVVHRAVRAAAETAKKKEDKKRDSGKAWKRKRQEWDEAEDESQ